METPTLNRDFEDLLSTFAEAGVEYLLIGGYAVNYYGFVRYTGDLDLWVRPTGENAERVVEALTVFGFGVSNLSKASILSPRVVTRMGIPPYRLEILSSISGVDFDTCWKGRIEDEWDGVPVTLIGLDCLRANKAASGRLKDLADLEELSKLWPEEPPSE